MREWKRWNSVYANWLRGVFLFSFSKLLHHHQLLSFLILYTNNVRFLISPFLFSPPYLLQWQGLGPLLPFPTPTTLAVPPTLVDFPTTTETTISSTIMIMILKECCLSSWMTLLITKTLSRSLWKLRMILFWFAALLLLLPPLTFKMTPLFPSLLEFVTNSLGFGLPLLVPPLPPLSTGTTLRRYPCLLVTLAALMLSCNVPDLELKLPFEALDSLARPPMPLMLTSSGNESTQGFILWLKLDCLLEMILLNALVGASKTMLPTVLNCFSNFK